MFLGGESRRYTPNASPKFKLVYLISHIFDTVCLAILARWQAKVCFLLFLQQKNW